MNPFIELQISSLEIFSSKYLVHDYKKEKFVLETELGYTFSGNENLLFSYGEMTQRNSAEMMKKMLEYNLRESHIKAANQGFPQNWIYNKALIQ